MKPRYAILLLIILVVAGGVYLAIDQPTAPISTTVNSDAPTPLSCADELAQIKEIKLPGLSEYPATSTYAGPIAEVNEITSEGQALRFYSHFQAGREAGVRFAGRYTIATWAMTGWGHSLGIMDAETGEAKRLPTNAVLGFEYSRDSRLVIVDSPSITLAFAEKYGEAVCPYLTGAEPYPQPKVYEIKNGGFNVIDI